MPCHSLVTICVCFRIFLFSFNAFRCNLAVQNGQFKRYLFKHVGLRYVIQRYPNTQHFMSLHGSFTNLNITWILFSFEAGLPHVISLWNFHRSGLARLILQAVLEARFIWEWVDSCEVCKPSICEHQTTSVSLPFDHHARCWAILAREDWKNVCICV